MPNREAECNINQITAKSNDSEEDETMKECSRVPSTKGIILVGEKNLSRKKNDWFIEK